MALLLRRSLHATTTAATRSSTGAGTTAELFKNHKAAFFTVLGYTAGGLLIFYTFTTCMQKYLVKAGVLLVRDRVPRQPAPAPAWQRPAQRSPIQPRNKGERRPALLPGAPCTADRRSLRVWRDCNLQALEGETAMLRNLKDLQGYALRATDGDVGTVKDFYFDDERWVVRYLVVETGSWLASRRVLI